MAKKRKTLRSEMGDIKEEITMCGRTCDYSETSYIAADGVETIRVNATPKRGKGNVFSMPQENYEKIFGKKKK